MAGSVGIVILVVGGLGAIVLVWLCTYLQKKLRIFTKGTMLFMVTTLMIATAVMLVEYGNDIRNKEYSAKRVARRNVAVNFLRSWFEGDRAAMLAHVDIDYREEVAAQIDRADQKKVGFLDDERSKTVLVALNVSRHSSFGFDGHGWDYRALLDIGDAYLEVWGRVGVTRPSDGRPGQVRELNAPSFNRTRHKQLVRWANAYRNRDYAY